MGPFSSEKGRYLGGLYSKKRAVVGRGSRYPIFGELQQIGYLCGGMRYLVKILAVLFAVIFVSCQAEYDYKPMQDKTSLVHVGDAAPDFTVNLLSGQSVSLSKYRDRVVMVVFFYHHRC